MLNNRITAFFIMSTIMLSTVFASPDISGYYRNYIGGFINGDYSIIQNALNLNIESSGSNYAFKVNPYIYSYDDKPLEMGVREAYVDLYFDSVDLRIGKQQIIWGKADGVFITDVISPKNMSDFLLPDFEEIRTGITAIKYNYYFEDSTLEIVGVPYFTPTQMPESGSPWLLSPSFPVKPTYDYSQKKVPAQLANGEVFVKYSALNSLMDYELMFGSMWDDDPTMHVDKTISASMVTAITVTPKHHRLNLVGGSISTELLGVVLRAESAYYQGKYFNSNNPSLLDGVIQKDYIHSLLGVDGSLWGMTMSGQWISKMILNYDNSIVNDEVDNTLTLMIRKDLLRETLHLELFSYLGLNNSDALIRPKVTYDLDDGVKIIAGANWFIGTTGVFGSYDANDMVYTKVQVSF